MKKSDYIYLLIIALLSCFVACSVNGKFWIKVIIISLCFTSCKTHFTTAYRITTKERHYYCNNPKFVNDTVRGAELKRNGKILRVFEIPYDSIVSIDFNDRLYKWKL